MKAISKYWNLLRLDSSGRLQITEINQAKQFFVRQFSLSDFEDISDSVVQKKLVVVKNSQDKNSIISEICLRCFISHQIRQACIQLDVQFGREHGFSRNDLFIYTLNDTLDNFRDLAEARSLGNAVPKDIASAGFPPEAKGRLRTAHCAASPTKSKYKPLAIEILATFDPSKANLSTWTSRYVRQNRELQRFLLEQGVYLVSNWAILNDTKIEQVKRVLSEFHNLTPTEIERATILLSAYHSVYRRDRLKNRQSRGVKCQTPTTEQLARISSITKQQINLNLSPEQTLSLLEQLANLLREYRIHVRGGKIKQESWDNKEINTERMQADIASSEDDVDRIDWLKSYQQQFQQSLDKSIAAVITNRLSKFKGKKAAKATQFITALELFHCQGESMSAIAPKIELQAQYQVTRLLKLKELRVDIRHHMLQLMRDWTMDTRLEDLNLLKQREKEIESALAEQIDLVLDEAEKEVSIADSTQSVLAKRICAYLDGYDLQASNK